MTCWQHVKIIDPIDGERIVNLTVTDGKITHMEDVQDVAPTATLVPGYIDVHIHGAAGHDVMDATHEALSAMSKALVKEGTTSFLATTMTQSDAAITAALQAVATFTAPTDGAHCIGVHLEGPYVSVKRAGAQPLEHIVPPSIEQFTRWQQHSGQRIRIATVAAEVDGALPLIERFSDTVIFSLGHTDASHVEMLAAKQAGAQHITHLYNQMSPFLHRDVQAIGTALLDDAFFTELIVDGIHSSKEAVQLAYKMKTATRLVLITDAMRAKQMPPGQYDLGGQHVTVTAHDARLHDGTLAGSIVTMDAAVRNMRAFTQCSDVELVYMSSYNAARQLQLNKGRIAVGYDADFVNIDDDWNVRQTIKDGQVVYEAAHS